MHSEVVGAVEGAHNAKISPVSTPILTRKAAIFKIYQKNLWKTSENLGNRKEPSQKIRKILKSLNTSQNVEVFKVYFGILVVP